MKNTCVLCLFQYHNVLRVSVCKAFILIIGKNYGKNLISFRLQGKLKANTHGYLQYCDHNKNKCINFLEFY